MNDMAGDFTTGEDDALRIVIDSSTLFNFLMTRRTSLLADFPAVFLVIDVVSEEVSNSKKPVCRPYLVGRAQGHFVEVTDAGPGDYLRWYMDFLAIGGVDSGEAAALAYAKTQGLGVAIDDVPAITAINKTEHYFDQINTFDILKFSSENGLGYAEIDVFFDRLEKLESFRRQKDKFWAWLGKTGANAAGIEPTVSGDTSVS